MKPEPILKHRVEPIIIRPFGEADFSVLRQFVGVLRQAFVESEQPYRDHDHPVSERFNRWYVNDPDFAVGLHRDPRFVARASKIFGRSLKPSYCIASMYGPEGVCPAHTDRPQCQYTIDLLLDGGIDWPLYIEGLPYRLSPGEAICYSGTGQRHWRLPMRDECAARHADLMFFHFVPSEWRGSLA